jgi:hypothetical protein
VRRPRGGDDAVRPVPGAAGRGLRGVILVAGSEHTLFEARSVHRLAGAEVGTPGPVASILARDGASAVARCRSSTPSWSHRSVAALAERLWSRPHH